MYFEFEVIHIPGTSNPADMLSRFHKDKPSAVRTAGAPNREDPSAPDLSDAGEVYTPTDADLKLAHRAMYGRNHMAHT